MIHTENWRLTCLRKYYLLMSYVDYIRSKYDTSVNFLSYFFNTWYKLMLPQNVQFNILLLNLYDGVVDVGSDWNSSGTPWVHLLHINSYIKIQATSKTTELHSQQVVFLTEYIGFKWVEQEALRYHGELTLIIACLSNFIIIINLIDRSR